MAEKLNGVEIHGFNMAGASEAENLNLERRTADPALADIKGARVWENASEGVIKFATVNAQGAVNIEVFANVAELQAAEQSARDYADEKVSSLTNGAFTDLESLVNTINGDSSVEGSFRKQVADVVGAAPEALDTLKEIADSLASDPNLDATLRTLVSSSIESAKSELKGAVSSAMDTMEEIENAFNQRNSVVDGRLNGLDQSVAQNVNTIAQETTDRQEAITAEQQARSQAIASEQSTRAQAIEEETAARMQAIASEQSARSQAIEGEATARAQAISEEAEARDQAIEALRGAINSREYAEVTATPAKTHTIAHNLGAVHVVPHIWTADGSGNWKFAIVPHREVDNNTLEIGPFDTNRNVKVHVQAVGNV